MNNQCAIPDQYQGDNIHQWCYGQMEMLDEDYSRIDDYLNEHLSAFADKYCKTINQWLNMHDNCLLLVSE